eukprot:SAG11_NODE_24761_length_368_cov_1.018587_1_plen_30_part_01
MYPSDAAHLRLLAALQSLEAPLARRHAACL